MSRIQLDRVRTHEDLLTLANQVIARHIRAAESSAARLKVPSLNGLMHRVPDKPLHSFPEVFFQLSGCCRFSFPEETLRLTPGYVCLVPRGMPHGEAVGPLRGPFYNLVFMFSPQMLAFHLAAEAPRGQPAIIVASYLERPAMPRPATYLEDLTELYHLKKGQARDAAVRGLLLAHLSSLFLILEGQAAPVRTESLKVAHARQLVLTRLNDPKLTVRQVARELKCSPDYLSWLFHRESGTPLNSFINEQRLLQARYLLTESDLNISEVAAATGFADPGYFARLFRRTTGQTPREFRRVVQHAG
jgi:AraC-like DNA-binding protein